ncbi:hypothetical protein P879_00252 [Paragonimus westermani]|uniref:DH domain-containing protein n=1 Tax=Paragonimus westermani TaxID=34504 RepID=A0A8T0DWJ8_9TREM|nr:hypothetical protein P879_00252 [Paragonimus westermani]
MAKSAAKSIVDRTVDTRTIFPKSVKSDVTTANLEDSRNTQHPPNNVQHRVRVRKKHEHLVAKQLYRVERQCQTSRNKPVAGTNVCTPERDKTQFFSPTSPSDVNSSFAPTSNRSGSVLPPSVTVSGFCLSNRPVNLVGSLRKIAVDCARGRSRGDEPLPKRVMTLGKKKETMRSPMLSSIHTQLDCKSVEATLSVNQSQIQSSKNPINPATEDIKTETSSTPVGNADRSVLQSPDHIESGLLVERPPLLLLDESTWETESPHTNSLVSSALLDIDQQLSIQSPSKPQKFIRACSINQAQSNVTLLQGERISTVSPDSHSIVASQPTSVQPQLPHPVHPRFAGFGSTKEAATNKNTGIAFPQVRPSQEQAFTSKTEHIKETETAMNGVSVTNNTDKRTCSSPLLTKSELGRVRETIGRIMDELIITERSYCRSLYVFSEVVAKTVCTKSGVRLKELRLLFPRCLPDLYSVHMKMLHRMDSGLEVILKPGIRSPRSQRNTCVSLPFVALLDSLSEPSDSGNQRQASVSSPTHQPIESTFSALYKRYLSEFTVAMKTMRKLSRQSSRFRQTLKRLQQHPECDGFDFSAFLLAPVQRLPRYLLLVKQLSRQFAKLVSTSFGLVIGHSSLPINMALAQTTQIEDRLHKLLVYLDSQLATYLEKPTGLQPNGVCSSKDLQSDFAQTQTSSPDNQTKTRLIDSPNELEKTSSKGIWSQVQWDFIRNKEKRSESVVSISEVSLVGSVVNQAEVHLNSIIPKCPVLTNNPQLLLPSRSVTTPQQLLQNCHMVELDSDDCRCKQPNISVNAHDDDRTVEFQAHCPPAAIHSTLEQHENNQPSSPELESLILQPLCNTASLSIPCSTDSNTQTSPQVAWSKPLIDPLSNNFCNACKVTLLAQTSDAVNREQSSVFNQMATQDPTSRCPIATNVQRHKSEPSGFSTLSKGRLSGHDEHILSEEQVYFSTTQLTSSRWDSNDPMHSCTSPHTGVTSTANVQRALSDPCKVHLKKDEMQSENHLRPRRDRTSQLERTKSVAVAYRPEGQKSSSGKTGSLWKISLRNLFRRKTDAENSRKKMSANHPSKNEELSNGDCERFSCFNNPSIQNVHPTTPIQTMDEVDASCLVQKRRTFEFLPECNTYRNPPLAFVRSRYPLQTKPTSVIEQDLDMAAKNINTNQEVFLDETGNPCFEI